MQSQYLNPVDDRPFADPFVLKYCGEYWAYCTGAWRDGRWFGVLRSRDLARWEEVGGAMEPLPGAWPCLWAPEVSLHGGRFYLYYSCGDEATMQIRVAVAEHPAGPFRDSGRRLTAEPFAIDPHVFADEDGARYLFYATDFLEHSHVGTGTVCDRMRDPFTLAGRPTPVTRPRYDWQVFDPARIAKGGVRWHTIEGSFVLKRKGRYYQMFSGGNWQNLSYGVSYAATEQIGRDDEWEQAADGQAVLPILRTIPGQVIGPGHNSAVRGPDNRELYCVYHRWAPDGSARLMAIDPLDWAGERMFVIGPSTTERPLVLPTWADFFAGPGLDPAWVCEGGAWTVAQNAAVQTEAASARASFAHTPRAFLAELSLAAREPAAPGGYGVAIGSEILFLIEPRTGRAVARVRRAAVWEEWAVALPANFAPQAFHLLRIEVGARRVSITLDEGLVHWSTELPGEPGLLALASEGTPAAFAGFALTEGWQDLFEGEATPESLGWRAEIGRPEAAGPAPMEAWQIADGALVATARPEPALLLKGPLPAAYELAVNLRLADLLPTGGRATLYPAARPDELGPSLTLRGAADGFALTWSLGDEGGVLPLPAGFDGGKFHQLRMRVAEGRLRVSLEGEALGELPALDEASHVGLAAQGAAAAFELVRVTALAIG